MPSPQQPAPNAAKAPKAPKAPNAKTRRAQSETSIALHAYQVYEHLGPARTYPALLAALRAEEPTRWKGKDATVLRRLKQWASDHDWRGRSRGYDDEQEQKVRKELDDRVAMMNKEHAVAAVNQAREVYQRMQQLLQLDQGIINAALNIQNALASGQTPPKAWYDMMHTKPSLALPGHVLAGYWAELITVERLARGAATEIAQQQHSGGIRIDIVTTARAVDGDPENPSMPFDQDPNTLLAADETGYTASDDEDDLDDDDLDDDDQDGEP